jgi:hypothetical protein
MTGQSPELEHAITTLEAKAAAREVPDLMRALLALKKIGADTAVAAIQRLITADESVRQEALDTAMYLRYRTAR